MKLPNHDHINQSVPDSMHTIKDVVENIVHLITGRKDSEKVRQAEIAYGRFGLAEKGHGTAKKSGRKKTQNLPTACFQLSSEEIKTADSHASLVILPSGDFTPCTVFSKPSQLKSRDWKEVRQILYCDKCRDLLILTSIFCWLETVSFLFLVNSIMCKLLSNHYP